MPQKSLLNIIDTFFDDIAGTIYYDLINRAKTSIKYNYILENFLSKNKIKHHFIKPRTLEHNGKVERSHRIDQEKFIGI